MCRPEEQLRTDAIILIHTDAFPQCSLVLLDSVAHTSLVVGYFWARKVRWGRSCFLGLLQPPLSSFFLHCPCMTSHHLLFSSYICCCCCCCCCSVSIFSVLVLSPLSLCCLSYNLLTFLFFHCFPPIFHFVCLCVCMCVYVFHFALHVSMHMFMRRQQCVSCDTF